MHESQKVKEARYFLDEMYSKMRDRQAFGYCLSAFLSASRSVIQYALAEAEAKSGKPDAQKWHNARLARYPLVNFFKDVRDINIHKMPAAPKKILKVESPDILHFRDSADARIKFINDKDQPVEIVSPTPDPPPPPAPLPAPIEHELRYEFMDRPGEELLTLCESYLKEVESYLKDGQDVVHIVP